MPLCRVSARNNITLKWLEDTFSVHHSYSDHVQISTTTNVHVALLDTLILSTLSTLRWTYIADVDSVGLGQFKCGSVIWYMNGGLFVIPDFFVFSLLGQKNTQDSTLTRENSLLLVWIHERTNFAFTKDAVAHITEVVGVLLGQDDGWEINDAGELHSAWGLAVQPLIENVLGISSFDDIHRILRRPAASLQPLQVCFVYSLWVKFQH